MSHHEAPPRVCAGCMTEVHDRLGRNEHVEYHYCEHEETLALIGVVDFRIVHWSLYGQVSPQEAENLIAKSVKLGCLVSGQSEEYVLH